jgi:hypothetical protein
MRKEVKRLRRSESEPCSIRIRSGNGASPDVVKEVGIVFVITDPFS